MRGNVNRQNNDEQRNLSSIGYIGGTLNYMGSGNLNMEYPYDNNPNHFNLWKPGNGYFPRGEAPPPYEEAVALAQAEALSAQCTVGVTTSTHRQHPATLCTMETPCDLQPNVTTNTTTNLININISNAGNITTMATGENHQINKSYSTHNTPNHLRLMQPQPTMQHLQYASLPMSAAQYELNSICQETITITPEIEAIPIENIVTNPNGQLNPDCHFRNCTISRPPLGFKCNTAIRRNDEDVAICQTPLHNRPRRNIDRHSSREDIDGMDANGAILPPPLFDEKLNNINDGSNVLNRSTGLTRRHHRTIPRNFATAEPIITTATVENAPSVETAPIPADQTKNSSKNVNKKPTCQCPVQHVPSTYMGATHLNSSRNQSNELFLSTLNRKHSNPKTLVAKSTSFPTDNVHDVVQSPAARVFPRDMTSIIFNEATPNVYPSNQPTLRRQKTPVKIQTISKQICNPDGMIRQQQQIQPDLRRRHGQSAPLTLLADSLKTVDNPVSKETSPANIISKNEIVTNSFPIQLIESMSKISTTPEIQKNPILPPKMSKINHNVQQQQLQYVHQQPHQQQFQQQFQQQQPHGHNFSSARIQTISKPNGDTAFIMATSGHRSSLPKSHMVGSYSNRNHYHHQPDVPPRSDRSKSLPRNDDKGYVTSSVVTNNSAIDKSYSSGKLNFTTCNFPMLTNHYTLPKTTTSKTSLNSTIISDVVSKVPSVINIPSPYDANNTRLPSPSASKALDHENRDPGQSHKQHKSVTVAKLDDKALPACTTYKNCSNPKEHFLPNDTSLDDDYLSECENCKSAHGSRYYLDESIVEQPQETMTLQRKIEDKEEEQNSYYRTSSTLPTNTKQKTTTLKNRDREPWFSTIPASSSSDEDAVE